MIALSRFLTIVPLALAAACASMQASKNSQWETKVFAVGADYNALLSVAVAYESQPRCAQGQKLGCSDTNVVVVIRKTNASAKAVLEAAEDTVRTPGVTDSKAMLALTAATEAVGALRTILTVNGLMRGG